MVKDWLPEGMPEWFQQAIELTYVSMVVGANNEEIITRLGGLLDTMQAPSKVAQDLINQTKDQFTFDRQLAEGINRTLVREIGLTSSDSIAMIVHAIIYHYRRGNSPETIMQKANQNELAFANTNGMPMAALVKLVFRVIDDVSKVTG